MVPDQSLFTSVTAGCLFHNPISAQTEGKLRTTCIVMIKRYHIPAWRLGFPNHSLHQHIHTMKEDRYLKTWKPEYLHIRAQAARIKFFGIRAWKGFSIFRNKHDLEVMITTVMITWFRSYDNHRNDNNGLHAVNWNVVPLKTQGTFRVI